VNPLDARTRPSDLTGVATILGEGKNSAMTDQPPRLNTPNSRLGAALSKPLSITLPGWAWALIAALGLLLLLD
jgi:hypothetical protein